MSALLAEKPRNENFPIVTAASDLEHIAEQFFRFDCVKVENLVSADKLKYFRDLCEKMYADDDARFLCDEIKDPYYLRQYQNGWIWEDRLRSATNNAFCYSDIAGCRRLYQILDRLMGWDWYAISPSQIRRSAPELRTKHWGSPTTPHFDAQWGSVDRQFVINVWVPFTSAGRTASSLEFILSDAATMLDYARYDPAKPLEPPGPGGINPRFDYNRMERSELDKHFTADQYWFPELSPGDVMIFSHWSAHSTRANPGMTDTRISLEWRVRIPTFDTPTRPIQDAAKIKMF
ncbi:MAG: hypothetical protein AB7H77_10615 [Bdellovibrionales bacterium]